MNFLWSAAAKLTNAGSVPGLPGYTLGERDLSFEGRTIWTLSAGIKRDDQTPVSVFSCASDQRLDSEPTFAQSMPPTHAQRSRSRAMPCASSARCGIPTSSSFSTASSRTRACTS